MKIINKKLGMIIENTLAIEERLKYIENFD